MPRSGTKLLREMLGGHQRIRFPEVETEFFPFWVSHWPEWAPLDDHQRFLAFYEHCQRLPFFLQCSEKGLSIDAATWFEKCNDFGPAGVFSGLLRTLLNIEPEDPPVIWGDKSPSYIRHIPLLKKEFPTARVVHIVRDVRDFCLSINKAWGKSMLRAAQRWQDDVSKARRDGQSIGKDYVEVRYEDVLARPRTVLGDLCTFIGLEFDEGMLRLQGAIENRGDAKGVSGILRDNSGKYCAKMPDALIDRIERIAAPTLRALGYSCRYEGPGVRLSALRMSALQVHDGMQLLRVGTERRNLLNAIEYNLRYFRVSGNRFR